jgi:hypothetical protein
VDIILERCSDHWGIPVKAVPYDETIEMPMPEVEGDGIYTITYVDQNGDPVPGVMCQVCDEASCRVFVSDGEIGRGCIVFGELDGVSENGSDARGSAIS